MRLLEVTKQFSMLKNKNILNFFLGQFFSNIGDRFFRTTIALLAYQVSGKVGDMGIVLMASSLPALLFSIPSGVLADRYSKKILIIIADTIRALTSLVIPVSAFFGFLTIPLLMAVTFVMGTMSQLFAPSQRSIGPSLVPKGDLLSLNALMATTEQFVGIIGPAIAAFLMLALAKEKIFYITSLAYIASVVTITFMNYKEINSEIKEKNSVFFQLKFALIYLKSERTLLSLIISFSILNFFLVGLFGVITPLLAKNVLQSGDSSYGFFMSTLMAGMFSGAIMSGIFKSISKEKIFIFGYFFLAIMAFFVGISEKYWVVLPAFFIFGFFMTIVNIYFQTLIQERTDPLKLGLVFSLYFFISGALDPASAGVTGILANYFKPEQFFIFTSVAFFINGIIFVFILSNKSIKRSEKYTEV